MLFAAIGGRRLVISEEACQRALLGDLSHDEVLAFIGKLSLDSFDFSLSVLLDYFQHGEVLG